MSVEELRVIGRAEERKRIEAATRVKEAMRVLARQRSDAFCQYVIKVEGSNKLIQLAPSHKKWHRWFAEHDRMVMWSHPEGGKTWQLIGYCLYKMGINPNIRIAWASNTYSQAEKPVKSIMQYLLTSQALREVFPNLRPSRRKGDPFGNTELTIDRPEISKDPTLATCGAYGSILGARIDLLILDDVVGFANTANKEQRDKLAEWVSTELMSRLSANAQVIVVGNTWHTDDLLHRLAENKLFVSGKFPVMTSEGVPTWPENWPISRIEKKRQEMNNPLLFARTYLCEVRDDGSSRFQRTWIDQALKRGKGKSFQPGLQAVPEGCRVYSGVDLGVQQKATSDRSVIFTGLVHPNGDREVLDIQAGRWQAPEIIQRLYDTHYRYQSIIYVESVAAQDYIRQWLHHSTDIPVRPFQTGKNKLDPDFGIESLATEFYAAKWIVPEFGTPEQIAERDIWLKELYHYDKAKHTGDSAMACWIFREGIRQGHVRPEVAKGKNWFGR